MKHYLSQKNLITLLVILSMFLIYLLVDKHAVGSTEVDVVIEELVLEEKDVVVEVSGAVVAPGVYELGSGSRVVDALSISGGVSGDANVGWVSQKLNLSEKLEDSQKVYIPFEWENVVESMTIGALEGEESSNTSGINVNTADLETLQSLSGVGATYAQKVIDNRPYKDLAEFKNKSKLSESLIGKIESSITF